MSEAERKRRQNYKRNRKKWILIQSVVLAVLVIFTALCAVTYVRLGNTYYADFTEQSTVDYKVKLYPNDYLDEWQESGQNYVSSLVESVLLELDYKLDLADPDALYDYSYDVVAELDIKNNRTEESLFSPNYVLVAEKSVSGALGSVIISEDVNVDFKKYDTLARDFIRSYGLSDVTCTLTVKMNIDTTASAEAFLENCESEYFVAAKIPLATKTFGIDTLATVPGVTKPATYKSAANQSVYGVAFWISAPIDLLLAFLLVAFIYLTRNHDINYAIKVNKIVSNYKSYIQKINNGFDTAGYQLLMVDTFAEMLGIRDTIQSPILMDENEDKTSTKFLIPTNTKILYVFEIRVDDYDEIYRAAPTENETVVVEETETVPCAEPTVIELVDDTPVVAEPADEEAVECAQEVAAPVSEIEEAEEAPTVEIEIIDMNEPVEEIIPEPVIEEVTPEPVIEEVTPEPVIEEVTPEPVIEEVTPEPVIEEVIPEPVIEEITPEPVIEEATSETEQIDAVIEPEPEATTPAPINVSADEDGIAGDNTRIIDGHVVHVRYRTSFMSRLIQAEPAVQEYYSTVKNQLLFYKGVKARTSWNFESFKKGRIQCAKLNVKGASLLVYLALDPKEYNVNKYYFTDVSDKPKLSDVPMLLKVKSERSLKYALELIHEMMQKSEIELVGGPAKNYCLPYESTEALIAKDLIKVLLPSGAELHEHSVIERVDIDALLRDARVEEREAVLVEATVSSEVETAVETCPENVSLPEEILPSETTFEEEIREAMATPDVVLSEVDFVDEIDEVYEETEEKPGVDVIGVVWPERAHKNKIYRYDPDGEILDDGDVVLVPTRDVSRNREVVRKAAVAHGNHKIDPELLHHPLKKIISVVKRKVEEALSSDRRENK